MFDRILNAGALFAALMVTSTAFGTTAGDMPADASVENGVIVVRGEPFFPVMLIDQCGAGAAENPQDLGVNVILNESCPDLTPQDQLASISADSLGVLPISSRATTGPKLLGWTYPDEPENNGWLPASLKQAQPYKRGNNDGHLSFLTTGGGFFHAPYRDARVDASTYKGFIHLSDVAGFDLYPLNHCQANLVAVYDAQRAFVAMAGSTPTFQWIETGAERPDYCGGFQMTPAELRAEVWLAIAGGARGIGYFTHTWTPDHHPFDVAPPLQNMMKRTAALMSAVRPGLLGETIGSSIDTPAIKVLARIADGRIYIFAVNSLNAHIHAQLRITRLRSNTLQVLGEKRSLHVDNHNFADTFSPFAVHVYVQAG